MSTTKKTQPADDLRAKLDGARAKAKKTAVTIGGVVRDNASVAVASSKALTQGLKEIRAGYVADSRKAVETLRNDFKAVAAVKSPIELFRLQREQATRNFKAISATANKNAGEFRGLVAEKVAPMVKARLVANLNLFRKAA